MMKCWNDIPQDRPTCEEIQGWFQARPMIQGTRVEPERARDNTAFWEAVKAESDIEIDFERVREVLQGVSHDFVGVWADDCLNYNPCRFESRL